MTLSVYFLLVAILLMVGHASSYTARILQKEDPEHPKMCFDKATKSWHPMGSQWEINCEIRFCTFNSGTQDGEKVDYEIDINGCGIQVYKSPDCKEKPYNYNLSYPDCCPLKCGK